MKITTSYTIMEYQFKHLKIFYNFLLKLSENYSITCPSPIDITIKVLPTPNIYKTTGYYWNIEQLRIFYKYQSNSLQTHSFLV